MLALPCIGIAYFLQSGGPTWSLIPFLVMPGKVVRTEAGVDGHHHVLHLSVFLAVFLVKVLIATFLFAGIIAVAKKSGGILLGRTSFVANLLAMVLGATRIALLSFAIFGIFFQGRYAELGGVNIFWYVACIIWGLSISFDSPIHPTQ